MDINKVINSIKESKAFQYTLAASIFGIIVYSGISLFMSSKKNKNINKNVADNAIVSLSPKINSQKNPKIRNQKRILQEMEIDYKKANNPNDVYITPQQSNNLKNEVEDYNIKVENKIFQVNSNIKKDNNKDMNTTKNKTNENNEPKLLTYNEKNNQNEDAVPLQLNVLNDTTTKDNVQDKIELYAEIYKYSHPLKNNGELVVKDTYWNELSAKLKNNSYSNKKTQSTKVNLNTNNNNNNKEIIRIVPGSTFFARLMIPIENIYLNSVKPIAEIINGPLKGYKIIGNGINTQNEGIILSFNRLVSPTGDEYSIQAIGVQTKNLSPKFVDSINRHLVPRIVLATLATVADTLFNQNAANYTAPAQSILSQELQKMLQQYPTEIKVNPKYFVVIFY